EDAKKNGADLLRGLKYGQEGYFWADTTEGVNVVLLGKPVEGKSRINTKDAKGKEIVKEFIKNGTQSGGGFTDYYFAKKDGSVEMPKRSYTLLFAPFGWVVGTGNYVDDLEALVKKADDENQENLKQEIYLIIGCTLALVILITIIAIPLTRTITKPLRLGVEFAAAVQAGDLSGRLRMASGDEIGALANAMDNMADSLDAKAKLAGAIADGDLTREVHLASNKDVLGQALEKMVFSLNDALGQANEAVDQAVSGSTQVSDASQSLSQGASEQAAALEQITSSLTEIASQTKSNAENASQANQIALSAKQAAEGGNSQMAEMNAAMKAINDSSKEIAKIIKAIDGIAFQTNLLALNAAVEAARAGKHGKGFAVVAQEVRNLAGRSAKAAQETAELIETSVSKVEHGADILSKTADSLVNIVTEATKVADLVGEISAASNEQAQGLAQINQGLSQIEQVTNRNTANAEQTASAAEELSGQAMRLREIFSQFKLKTQASSTSTASRGSRHTGQPKQLVATSRPLPERDGHSDKPQPLRKGKQIAGPEEIISLDDKDFGKF
ncbi:MAG: cache domain-containing protein, partial [Deltaproteobacteria bacterium]|nr:cache domain-containing protein [Deltaproteobacteria bacterium]